MRERAASPGSLPNASPPEGGFERPEGRPADRFPRGQVGKAPAVPRGGPEGVRAAAVRDLPAALRAAASAALPRGAFLRRDRGDALYVTDAPRIDPRADRAALLREAGFLCAEADGLLRLWPAESWLAQLEAATPDPPDDLCRGLLRFRGMSPDGESLKLFALGLRCLESGEGAARFDRLLRQRAAQCLRENRAFPRPPAPDPPVGAPMRRPPEAIPDPGGGLYACALLDHELEVHPR